jgi:hypothetical protein
MTTGTMKARNGRDCCKARKQVQFQLAVGNARLDVTLAHETTRQSTVKGSKTTTGMEAWTAVELRARQGREHPPVRAVGTVHGNPCVLWRVP